MKNYFIFLCLSLASCAILSPESKYAARHDWHEVFDPSSNKAQVYGGYAAGCVDGAVPLPEKGEGYTSMSRLVNRFYGHPDLIAFIEKLGKKVKEKYNRQILVNDLGHARGGPADINSSAHRSHQIGLDVDIWFRHMPAYVDVRSDTYPTSVLAKDRQSINTAGFNSKTASILRETAMFEEVERILATPRVKKLLCERYKGQKWLNKIRPWWGHSKHFHVRLKCPDDNPYCTAQAPVPDDDGCGAELNWWFSEEAEAAGEEKSEEKRKFPNLPKQCDAVWNN